MSTSATFINSNYDSFGCREVKHTQSLLVSSNCASQSQPSGHTHKLSGSVLTADWGANQIHSTLEASPHANYNSVLTSINFDQVKKTESLSENEAKGLKTYQTSTGDKKMAVGPTSRSQVFTQGELTHITQPHHQVNNFFKNQTKPQENPQPKLFVIPGSNIYMPHALDPQAAHNVFGSYQYQSNQRSSGIEQVQANSSPLYLNDNKQTGNAILGKSHTSHHSQQSLGTPELGVATNLPVSLPSQIDLHTALRKNSVLAKGFADRYISTSTHHKKGFESIISGANLGREDIVAPFSSRPQIQTTAETLSKPLRNDQISSSMGNLPPTMTSGTFPGNVVKQDQPSTQFTSNYDQKGQIPALHSNQSSPIITQLQPHPQPLHQINFPLRPLHISNTHISKQQTDQQAQIGLGTERQAAMALNHAVPKVITNKENSNRVAFSQSFIGAIPPSIGKDTQAAPEFIDRNGFARMQNSISFQVPTNHQADSNQRAQEVTIHPQGASMYSITPVIKPVAALPNTNLKSSDQIDQSLYPQQTSHSARNPVESLTSRVRSKSNNPLQKTPFKDNLPNQIVAGISNKIDSTRDQCIRPVASHLSVKKKPEFIPQSTSQHSLHGTNDNYHSQTSHAYMSLGQEELMAPYWQNYSAIPINPSTQHRQQPAAIAGRSNFYQSFGSKIPART
jgi:hypothetical protein